MAKFVEMDELVTISKQMEEELQQVGENVQVVQGELITSLGDISRPNYQSLINGTLVPDGDDFTLELVGTGESPFIYG